MAYLVVGVYVATLGPLGRDIRRQAAQLRPKSSGSSLPEWKEGRLPPLVQLPRPRWKTAAFIVVITAGAMFGWALFLPGYVGERRAGRQAQAKRAAEPDRSGLRFTRMGGVGKFDCDACGYEENVLSDMHSFRGGRSVLGYQCKRCLCFRDVKQGPDIQPDLHCECGGELSRDEKVLCPGCGSDRVKFMTTLIS